MQYTKKQAKHSSDHNNYPMKNILLTLLIISNLCYSQEFDIEKLKGIKPRAIGPAGMSGRITAIDVVNDQPSVIYVGAASGGVWKSESEGIAWVPVFDKENIQPNRHTSFNHKT